MVEFQNKNRIFGLDVMRAAAIIMVLFGHCVWIYPEGNSVFHQLMVLSGFMGVETFFVLSGFLIGKICYQLYLKDDFKIKNVFVFLKRRWFRTLPNYYLILLINIGIAAYIGYSPGILWHYFFFFQNSYFTMSPFFPESWSLAVEEYAYFILPLCLVLVGGIPLIKQKSRSFLIVVLALIGLFIVAKIGYTLNSPVNTLAAWNVSLKAVVVYRLDSIFIGVLCSWLYCNYIENWQRYKLFFALLGVSILIFQFVAIGYFKLFIESVPMLWNVFYLPIVSIAVACFLPFMSEWNEQSPKLYKPIVTISVLSYSLYLLHYSIVLQLMKYFIKYDIQNMISVFGFVIGYVCISFFLSYLLYVFYEKPMMDLRDKS
jgi:peptidoglycan/LPS O-acetylase OafA/YrhL